MSAHDWAAMSDGRLKKSKAICFHSRAIAPSVMRLRHLKVLARAGKLTIAEGIPRVTDRSSTRLGHLAELQRNLVFVQQSTQTAMVGRHWESSNDDMTDDEQCSLWWNACKFHGVNVSQRNRSDQFESDVSWRDEPDQHPHLSTRSNWKKWLISTHCGFRVYSLHEVKPTARRITTITVFHDRWMDGKRFSRVMRLKHFSLAREINCDDFILWQTLLVAQEMNTNKRLLRFDDLRKHFHSCRTPSGTISSGIDCWWWNVARQRCFQSELNESDGNISRFNDPLWLFLVALSFYWKMCSHTSQLVDEINARQIYSVNGGDSPCGSSLKKLCIV
jgi:hypothetical protein